MIWLVATTIVLVVLVRLDGIRGAALTHAILLIPLAVAYATGGARRIGLSTRRLVTGVGGILGAVAVQGAITAGAIAAIGALGAHADLAAGAGAAVGLVAVALVLWRLKDSPLREARTAAAALRHGSA